MLYMKTWLENVSNSLYQDNKKFCKLIETEVELAREIKDRDQITAQYFKVEIISTEEEQEIAHRSDVIELEAEIKHKKLQLDRLNEDLATKREELQEAKKKVKKRK